MDAGRIGEVLDVWQLNSLIGSGGMGDVYRAHRIDDVVKQDVAIKVLRAEYQNGAPDEADMLRPLVHPNIARCFDDGLTRDGHRYLVMEYIEGSPITDYADQQGLSIHARLDLYRQACAAIEYAHHHVVVHADLKPANILVNRDGVVKVIDFGIARRLHGHDAHLASSAFSGAYGSPEQIQGRKLGFATDIYALGAVLYELLCGHEPFDSLLSAAELERQIVEESPRRPSSALTTSRLKLNETGKYFRLEPGVIAKMRGGCRLAEARKLIAGDLDHICLFALRKEPDRRYESIEDLTCDIDRVLDGRKPANAPSGDPIYTALRAARRRPLEIMAAVAVMTAALASFSVSQLFWEGATASVEYRRQFDQPADHCLAELKQTLQPQLASDPRFHDSLKALEIVLRRAAPARSVKSIWDKVHDDLVLQWRRAKRIIPGSDLFDVQ